MSEDSVCAPLKIVDDLNAIIVKLEVQEILKLELSDPHRVSVVFEDIVKYLQAHRDVAKEIKDLVLSAKKDLEDTSGSAPSQAV